ncbi:MAG: hypothetical protein U5R30_09570 [Deltaproteobacteria bacterium]|nr:hypothetical protein [Deltaproteobacteria bacterium]
MARPLRAELPGAFYHVINRGNAGEDSFKNLGDRGRVGKYLEAASSAGIFGRRYVRSRVRADIWPREEKNLARDVAILRLSYAKYRKMIQEPLWATGYLPSLFRWWMDRFTLGHDTQPIAGAWL